MLCQERVGSPADVEFPFLLWVSRTLSAWILQISKAKLIWCFVAGVKP
jgi:hypothetical protein